MYKVKFYFTSWYPVSFRWPASHLPDYVSLVREKCPVGVTKFFFPQNRHMRRNLINLSRVSLIEMEVFIFSWWTEVTFAVTSPFDKWHLDLALTHPLYLSLAEKECTMGRNYWWRKVINRAHAILTCSADSWSDDRVPRVPRNGPRDLVRLWNTLL